MFAGLPVLWSNRTLRAAVILVAALNAVGAPLVLVTVVLLRSGGTPSWQVGCAMAGLAVGGLAGAALVGPLHKLLSPGAILIGLGAVETLLFAGLWVPGGPLWVAVLLFAAMLGVPTLRVLVDVLIFRQVPEEQRGRVIAGVMTLFTLGAPLGVATAGLLLQSMQPRSSVLVLACVVGLITLGALTSRSLRGARWP